MPIYISLWTQGVFPYLRVQDGKYPVLTGCLQADRDTRNFNTVRDACRDGLHGCREQRRGGSGFERRGAG